MRRAAALLAAAATATIGLSRHIASRIVACLAGGVQLPSIGVRV